VNGPRGLRRGDSAVEIFHKVEFIAVYYIEVKSTNQGAMKSMHLFLDSHPNSKFGLKISMSPFSKYNNLIEIPLYALESWFSGNDTSNK